MCRFSLTMCLACLLAASPEAAGADELTPERRERLATAHDGGDHREEAFFALVESLREWDGAPPDEPIRMRIDPARMVDDPGHYRGQWCLVLGRLEQRTPLAPPYDVGEEWFIRDRSGEPVIVYVVDAEGNAFREGRTVRVPARFYKRLDAVARDGGERRYAAFIGARPQIVHATDGRAARELLIVLVPLVVLMGGFLALLVFVRRQRAADASPPRPVDPMHEAGEADPRPLPDDPAEALAELKRRADAAKE